MKPLTVKAAIFSILKARTRAAKEGFILVDSYFHCVAGRYMVESALTEGARPVKYNRKMKLFFEGIELRISR